MGVHIDSWGEKKARNYVAWLMLTRKSEQCARNTRVRRYGPRYGMQGQDKTTARGKINTGVCRWKGRESVAAMAKSFRTGNHQAGRWLRFGTRFCRKKCQRAYLQNHDELVEGDEDAMMGAQQALARSWKGVIRGCTDPLEMPVRIRPGIVEK